MSQKGLKLSSEERTAAPTHKSKICDIDQFNPRQCVLFLQDIVYTVR